MFCIHFNRMTVSAILTLSFFGTSQAMAITGAVNTSDYATERCNSNVSVSVSKDKNNNVTIQLNEDLRVFLLINDIIPVDIQDWAKDYGVSITAKDGNVSVSVVVESHG